MFYLLLIKYNNLKNFINYYKKNNNMVYVIIAIILSFMLFNKESFRNFSDFSILPSLLFILFFFSIILDLYNAANFGRYGFKDSVLLNVTFNYAIVIIYYGFLVIFIFTTHSLYKLEIDLFELFNYRFYLYFFNVYNNINVLLTFLTILVILQLLQNFLKKEYNNNFKVKYILMFLILLYVYNFFSIITSLLFKTALNPNKFFNLNNGSLSFLTSKNDSLLKNSIYNDNTRSE
jgi:hypothetical protein